jgi:hypothetical protein
MKQGGMGGTCTSILIQIFILKTSKKGTTYEDKA